MRLSVLSSFLVFPQMLRAIDVNVLFSSGVLVFIKVTCTYSTT
jgi:hypothetical protein